MSTQCKQVNNKQTAVLAVDVIGQIQVLIVDTGPEFQDWWSTLVWAVVHHAKLSSYEVITNRN